MLEQGARDANRTVLLAALHPEPAGFMRLLAVHGEVLDWSWLLEHAAAHKVSALLADRVAAAGSAAAVPAEAGEKLLAARTRAIERNAQGLRDLEQIDRGFAAAGIDYILLKGPALTQQVYDGPAQRSFFDLDVVVHENDVDAAQVALEGLGYRLWGGDRYFGFAPANAADLMRATRLMRQSLRRHAHELALVTDEHRLLPVDLHWNLMPPARLRARPAQLWERTATAVVGGIEVRVLDPEATVLHLAAHAWSNRPWSFALLHLCDVAWALRRSTVDAHGLAELADRWGGRDDLERSLYALEQALGVDLPAALQPRGQQRLRRFRGMVTPENLLEHCARPAAQKWARWRQDVEWGLAMGSLRSTGILLWAKYTALLGYRLGLGG